MTNFLYVYAAALLGLLVGGVINALSDDLPHTYRIRLPHYPDGTPRPLIAWLGTMAYISGYHIAPIGGSRLSWRHPLTEIVTAGLFAYVAAFHPFSPAVIFFWGNIFILALITVIDLASDHSGAGDLTLRFCADRQHRRWCRSRPPSRTAITLSAASRASPCSRSSISAG
ncbi:MAG: hypothetical protein U0528_14300 [Anaerolineae bacterium]